MSRRVGGAVFICEPDYTPGPRDDCPNPLHDYPLPSGYIAASDVAASRLHKRWRNVKCRDCGLYGWVPPLSATEKPTRPAGVQRPGSEDTAVTACVMTDNCPDPVAYLVKTEHSGDEWPMCTDHTAEMRACDPLGYIESVRSVRPGSETHE